MNSSIAFAAIFALAAAAVLLSTGGEKACTADARQCPDGSFVGRDPQNNCEFDPCPDACSLQPDPGPCDAVMPRYYYHQQLQTCEKFLWGGCDGVVPFQSLEECELAC